MEAQQHARYYSRLVTKTAVTYDQQAATAGGSRRLGKMNEGEVVVKEEMRDDAGVRSERRALNQVENINGARWGAGRGLEERKASSDSLLRKIITNGHQKARVGRGGFEEGQWAAKG